MQGSTLTRSRGDNSGTVAKPDRLTRVLLVDNSPERIEAVRGMLSERRRFRVCVSCSSPEIRRLCASDSIDIVLLCLDKGDRCLRSVAGALGGPTVPPVIVLTDPPHTPQLETLTPAEVLSRSGIDRSLLTHAITSVIEQHGTARELGRRIDEYQSSEARFLNVLLSSADGIVVVDSRNRVLFVNPAALAMFGETQAGMRRKELPYQIAQGESVELAIGHRGGGRHVVEMRAVDTTWEGERARLISLRDVTARKQAEEALRASEERYALAIRGSKDGVWDWDLRTDKIYFCAGWKAMLGYRENEITDSPNEWFSRIYPADLRRVRKAVADHIEGRSEHFESEYRIQHRDKTLRWVLARGKAVRSRAGRAIRIAGSHTDTTERKQAERQLKKALSDLRFALASEKVLMEELDRKNKELVELSITDGLTGLYNHRFIQERFDFEFKRIRRYGGHLSCMIIDIDHFKNVNDTYGHQFGDLVLRQIATLLKTRSREVDICGRYGGEEFMILANLAAEDALKFATKLHASIEDHVFSNNKHAVHITVSIGIAEYRSDTNSKQELIERADVALYQAKKDGRNLIRLWKEVESADDRAVDRHGVQDLTTKFSELSQQMRRTYLESTNALVKAVDAKDPFAREHSQKVSAYATQLAKFLRLPETEVEVIRCASLLHDIGKISIKQEILVKKEKLTPKEFEVLKKHPEVGVNILKEVKFLEKELPIILYHHERFDGQGYPYGLKGREIPLGARIVAVADAFDAMTSGRTYKKRLSFSLAVAELKRGSGSQFAPDIVEAFVKMTEQKRLMERV